MQLSTTNIRSEIPACRPCQNSGSTCEYTDGRSGNVHPRSVIHDLERELMNLETQIYDAENAPTETSPATSNLRSGDEAAQTSVTGHTEEHPTFAESSSGIVAAPMLISNPNIIQVSTWFDQHSSALSKITRISKLHQILQKRDPRHSHRKAMQERLCLHGNWQITSQTHSSVVIKFNIRFSTRNSSRIPCHNSTINTMAEAILLTYHPLMYEYVS